MFFLDETHPKFSHPSPHPQLALALLRMFHVSMIRFLEKDAGAFRLICLLALDRIFDGHSDLCCAAAGGSIDRLKVPSLALLLPLEAVGGVQPQQHLRQLCPIRRALRNTRGSGIMKGSPFKHVVGDLDSP